VTLALFAGGLSVIGFAIYLENGIPWTLAYFGGLAVLVAMWRGI